MRKAARVCAMGSSGAAAPNKGWRVFLFCVSGLLKAVGRALANKSGYKKHDSPQPDRQRRRAQQGQRVDCKLAK